MSLSNYIKESSAEYRNPPANEVGASIHVLDFNNAKISTFSQDYSIKIRKCLSDIYSANQNIFNCHIDSFIEAANLKNSDNAYTDKNVIYVKSGLDDKKLKRSLVHELMHNCIQQGKILATDDLKDEFVRKRKSLYNVIYHQAKNKSVVKKLPWYDLNRNNRIIDFFEKDIGYSLTSTLMYGIFPTINSIYSLDEYICEIAELIFFVDPSYARTVCPRGYEIVSTFLF